MIDLLRELWSRAECEEPIFSAEEIEWLRPGSSTYSAASGC